MTQENKPEGSEGPNQLSGKRDRVDGEDMAPFKKRVRFLSSDDLKEVTNDKTESSGANKDDVKVSSTSGHTDAGEVNEKDIIPTQKRSACTTCNQNNFSASLSQPAISESGDTGNEHGGDGGGKHGKENEELIEHTAAVGGSGNFSQTGTTVPGSRSGQNIEGDRVEDIQEAAMNDGSDGSSAPRREEQSKGDIFYTRRRAKQSSSPDEKPVQDKWAPEGESDNSSNVLQDVVSEENHIQKTEVDRNSKDESHEEVQNAATEVGEMNDDGGECRKDEMVPQGEDYCSDDAPDVVGDNEQILVVPEGEDEMVPEGEDDCSGHAPDVHGDYEHIPKVGGDTKQEDGSAACSPTNPSVECEVNPIDEALEAAVKDGHDGSHAPSGEDLSKIDNKLVDEDESEMIKDGSEEERKHVAMEHHGLGNNNINAPRSEEPMEVGENPSDYVVPTIDEGGHGCSDNALDDGKQAQELELVTKHGGGSSLSYADTTARRGEDDRDEQGQLAAMEDGGNENIGNNERGVEDQSTKGKKPVEADHHEQGQQQTRPEDGGDENTADVVVSREEVQDKKGKKPMKYVPSRKNPESGPDCNQNNPPDVVGDKEQPDHQGTNPDADGGSVPPTFAVSSEGDDQNNEIQPAAFEDPDTEIGNKNADANNSGYMAIQGDMQTQQDPMTPKDLRKRTRSIHEQGEASHDAGGDDTTRQEARKKIKYGSDGGSTSALCLDGAVGYNEPPMQQANRPFLLFGAPIPREQEHDVAIINTNDGLGSGSDQAAGGGELAANGSPPTQQPATNGIQLFGVYMTEEQVQPVAIRGIQLFGAYMITGEPSQSVELMQNRDRGNSHGGGESSMQQPKSGLRLFGYDI